VETHVIAQDHKIQKYAFCRQSDVDAVLGLKWALEHYQDDGRVVTSARYCALLEEELKSAIQSKSRGMLANGVVLLHNNTQPHAAAATVETIRELKFEILAHPTCSADVALCD
jgi:hypothetical protein